MSDFILYYSAGGTWWMGTPQSSGNPKRALTPAIYQNSQ